ncbi:MAG: ABC transporter permease [Burkholderiaceae bacterium]|nr:ABC transporter permease [Burkholderiaceae bacterium]
MMTLSLAVRNLLRNRRRSLATLLALAIGTASLLLFGGYSADIRYAMLTGYVRAGGHLQIQHRDFFLYGNGNPTAYAIRDVGPLIEAIRRDEPLKNLVTVVSPTLQFGGIAGNYDAGVSRTVIGTGFVADDVSRMREWNEYGIAQAAPRFALQGAAGDSAIVGIGVARVLLLCEQLGIPNCPKPAAEVRQAGPALPDDIAALAADTAPAAAPAQAPRKTGARIELLAGHGRGSPNVAALNVLAAEDQGMKELDEITVILPLKSAQQLVFGRESPRATAIMLQLHHTAQIPAARARLQQLLQQAAPGQPLTVLDFEVLNPFYRQTIDLFDTIFGFIFALIGGIVLFTVSNTMNAAVVERTTEIGTLRSVGLRQGGIRALFVTEGVLLGAVGAIVGVLSALGVAGMVNWMELTWLPPGSSERLPLNIRVWGETTMMVGAAVGLMFIAAGSAWWPAWRAARLKIVDALRHA